MKKIDKFWKKYVLPGIAVVLFVGCQEKETEIFDQPGGVHFTINEYSYSFKEKIGVERDTIKIPLEIYGKFSDKDRNVAVALVENDTAHVNTIEPGRYRILESVVPANSEDGTVTVELNYGEEMNDSVYVFHLKINVNDDFQEVSFKSNILKIQVTAKEIQPANWSGSLYSYLGDYSTRWWGFIKEATQRTSLPYWGYHNPDPTIWTMSDAEFFANLAVIKTALRKYNEGPDGPLVHDDGKSKDKPVEMRY